MRACAAAVALLLAGTAGETFANGRPPRTVDVLFRPGAPEQIAVAATFGLLRSSDGGATWRWACEQAIGYGGTYDPDYAYSGSGAIFATVFDGLVVSRDGCTFVPTSLGATLIAAIAIGPDGTLLAGAGTQTDSRLYRSTDDGVTFPTFSEVATTGDWWQSIEFAPSDASRVYATGYRLGAGGRDLTLYRSDDGGVSFAPLPLADFTAGELSVLEIAAVSPADPDLVFARMKQWNDVIGDAIYRSDDAGATWDKVLELTDEAPGVVVRGTTEVYVGTRNRASGSWVSGDGGQTFGASATALDVHCLRNHPTDGSIWICSHNYTPDLLGVGSGQAFGVWTPRLRFEDIAGPIPCAAGTPQQDPCGLEGWCGLKAQLGITSEEVACSTGSVDAGSGGGGGGDPPTCCGSARGSGGPGAAALFAVVVLVPVSRRRRR